MAPVAAPAWRLSVTTVGAAEMRFVVPCGDGDITVLELTRRLMERCQSLMPDVPLLADRLVDERDGSMLFPEDKAREVLDDGDVVKVYLRNNAQGGKGGEGGGAGRGRARGAGSSAPRLPPP